MNYSISNTAEYGEYVSGKRIVDTKTKRKNERSVKRHSIRQVYKTVDGGT